MRFKDKVAIVTGSGRGIGRATVLGFAREGARVVVNDVDEGPAKEVLAEVQAAGGRGTISTASVADRAAVQRMVDDAVAAFGTVDILVNNAAVTNTAMITKMTEEQWDRVVQIGLKGVFNCLQAVAPIFIERAKANPSAKCNGKVVNLSSSAGLRGTVGQINYGATKAGVIGLTMSAAREWGRYRINVNAIAPGVVETRLTETVRNDPRFAEQTIQSIVLGYFSTPEDVAPSILFLSSSDADYITGHVLNVSGGAHIGI